VGKTRPKLTCIYCGVREGTTDDHIPPRGLFASPRPNLVTVPCCEECQGVQQKDDEYFIRTIVFKRGIADNRSSGIAQSAALRALYRPRKAAFTRAFIDTVRLATLHSPEGLYLGKAMTYNADLNRLSNVVRRTTLGLHFRKFGKRVPDDHTCFVFAMGGFASADLKTTAAAQQIWDFAISGKRENYGDNVFSYWGQEIEGEEFRTLWAFLFYGDVQFAAVTLATTEAKQLGLQAS
jgi:hypothetical protein